MLATVFDNPRVHSNTGYHKTEETRKKHKENGLNCRSIVQLACDKYKCTQVLGKPQDRKKLIIFKHPTGVRIRVWLNTGTVGVMQKDKEVYIKKKTMSCIETYLDNPLKAFEDDKPTDDKSYSKYRSPLVNIDQYQAAATTASTSTSYLNKTDSRPVSCVDRSLIVSLACQHGFSKTCDQDVMIQFKNETKTSSVNVYTTKGTVMLQGKDGLKETRKCCTVAGFSELLGKVKNILESKPQFVSSIHMESEHAVKEGTEENETALIRAVRKAAFDASKMYNQ